MSAPVSLLRRIDSSGVPQLLARLAVGGIFVYLACMKLRDPLEFLKQMHLYNSLPTQSPQLINTVAVVLPWFEMLCALALVLGLWARGAAVSIAVMLLGFAPLLIIRALGLYHDPRGGAPYAGFCAVSFNCGCGTGDVLICAKLAENTALLAGALIVLISRSRRWSLDGLLAHRSATGCRSKDAARVASHGNQTPPILCD